MKKIFAWTILFALLLTLTACGSGGYDTPEEAAEKFVIGLEEQDSDLFYSSIPSSLRDNMEEFFERKQESRPVYNVTNFSIKEVITNNFSIIYESDAQYENTIEDRCVVRTRYLRTNTETGERTSVSAKVTAVKIDGSWYIESIT